MESETVRTSEVLRKKLGELTGTMKEGVEEVAKTAQLSAESMSKGGEKLGRTAAFRALSQGVESLKKEIDDSVLGQTGPY
ncbi:Mitochondrial import inner membrane translocase subunit TIM44 [Saguinus oedipus]|uniref:Mitochondrial import inner membrane translocase subunit TIM44 n=1 Tax=Saguinus oedipus TaxID=9490 RepID=A0ABQ9VWZ5_SAGOE|nr:Mitochondrial import inner membrane translocase subunit TIM44 [Saguinus oedipus]